MGSLENFHQEIMRRLQSSELQLEVTKAMGGDPNSVAFSKFWTLFSYFAAAGSVGIVWRLDGPWWWFVIGPLVAFFGGSVIGLGIISNSAHGFRSPSPLRVHVPHAHGLHERTRQVLRRRPLGELQ